MWQNFCPHCGHSFAARPVVTPTTPAPVATSDHEDRLRRIEAVLGPLFPKTQVELPTESEPAPPPAVAPTPEKRSWWNTPIGSK